MWGEGGRVESGEMLANVTADRKVQSRSRGRRGCWERRGRRVRPSEQQGLAFAGRNACFRLWEPEENLGFHYSQK